MLHLFLSTRCDKRLRILDLGECCTTRPSRRVCTFCNLVASCQQTGWTAPSHFCPYNHGIGPQSKVFAQARIRNRFSTRKLTQGSMKQGSIRDECIKGMTRININTIAKHQCSEIGWYVVSPILALAQANYSVIAQI